MSIKKFQFKENQELWSKYQEMKKLEGKTQSSINQYKVGVHALEKATNGIITNITVKQLQQAKESIMGKSNHINGFIVDMYLLGYKFKKESILSTLLEREQKIFKIIENELND